MLATVASSLAIAAIVVTTPRLPAGGTQETTLRADTSQRVRLTARTRFDATCTLVDRRRGPFVTVGAKDGACTMEELVDAGEYLLRIVGPRKVPKNAAPTEISAEPFVEKNVPIVRLDDRTAQTSTLAPGEQRSYALKVTAPGRVRLRIAGRTAGKVELWRDGEWREPLALAHETPAPTGRGRALHAWTFDGRLETGAYRLTVYGTEELRWENGESPTEFWISNGAPVLDGAPGVEVELPWHGLARFELATKHGSVLASLASSTKEPVSLSVIDEWTANDPGSPRSCSFGAMPLPAVCRVAPTRPGEAPLRREVVVRGPAGAKVTLFWAPAGSKRELFATSSLQSPPAMRNLLVATHELPVNYDSAPLSCELVEGDYRPWSERIVAREHLRIDPDRGLDSKFNYSGGGRLVFEVTSGGTHRIEALGERRNTCTVTSLDGSRVAYSSPERTTVCQAEVALSPGVYALDLRGGIEGIEHVRIVPRDARGTPVAGKASCVLSNVDFGAADHRDLRRSRGTDASIWGVSVLPLPATFAEPFAATIDPQRPLKIEVAANTDVQVRTAEGAAVTCEGPQGRTQATTGHCTFPPRNGKWELVLSAPGAGPIVAIVTRVPPKPPPAKAPAKDSLEPPKLPGIATGKAEGRDFDHGQAHSFVFDVATPGLYELTTEGLLSTHCALRTPVVLELAENSGAGRGRNCLVSQWLGTGRYRLTVRTQGASKGRGLVRLERREPVDKALVTADGESFFRVEAGDLVRQVIAVPKDGPHRLATDVLGGATSCRLEDERGWPLVPVPGACTVEREFTAGRYLWMQLPLTVESRRRTSIERVRPPITFKGRRLRFPELNREYDAELGPKGRDEYRFDVPARMEIGFSLQGALVARLVKLEGKTRTPIDMFRAQEGAGSAVEAPPEELSGEVSEEVVEEPSEPPAEEYGEEYVEEAPPEEYVPEPEPENPPLQSAPPPTVSAPVHSRELEPGVYALVVSHVRNDKFVRYRIGLSSETLAPGVKAHVGVPSTRLLRTSTPGLLRVRTRGTHDVRCRLFQGDRLVVESTGSGEDWNCSIAEPLPAGDYTLVFESESLTSGTAEVEVGAPKLRAIAAGEKAEPTLEAAFVDALPLAGSPDSIIAIEATGPAPFSCAVVAADGKALHRAIGQQKCSARVRVPQDGASLRLWTPAQPVKVSLTTRTLAIDRDGAAKRIEIPAAGRFRTDEDVWCLEDAARGALRPCGPETSLDAGRHVFVSARGSVPAPKALPLELDGRRTDEIGLDLRRIDVVRAKGDALHLLVAESTGQQPEPPGCGIAGGIRVSRGNACFAAGGLARESTQWLWSTGAQAAARVQRVVVEKPAESKALERGRHAVEWKPDAIRLSMPKAAWRTDLLLPSDAWAVVLEGGRVRELCAPAPEPLTSCRVLGTGGELVLVSAKEKRVELSVVEADRPAARVALERVLEQEPSGPGELVLEVAAAKVDRELEISEVDSCLATISDGSRARSCRFLLAANKGASISVRHDAKPWRALLATREARLAALLGPAPAAAGSLAIGRATHPSPGAVAYDFRLDKESAVHLRVDGGVCGLLAGTALVDVNGGATACAIDRVLPAGSHRVVVRPFASRPTAGRIELLTSAVLAFGEGVGAESWLAPGESRTGRFELDAPGKVGIGLRTSADVVECRLYDEANALRGSGCQQLAELPAGTYRLELTNPPDSRPLRVRPVVLGLSGTRHDIPEDYLRDLMSRIGAQP